MTTLLGDAYWLLPVAVLGIGLDDSFIRFLDMLCYVPWDNVIAFLLRMAKSEFAYDV